ncbi:penicillin-binding protein 2 [Panacibacter microcysteis]|uniref:penicillin-binding protein 2 n=1 Tax=Panacibacter microcysteis TaxID=2793269 RepID=UPI0031FBF78B
MIQLIFAVIFIVIIAQLLHLQMFSSDLKIQAENNAIFRKVVYPDRGIIYDRKKRAVLENTIMYDLVVTPNQVKGTDTAALCRILAIDTAEFRKRIITAIIKNSYYKPSAFAALVSPDTYARLNENMYKFPGFVLQERPVRTYPYSAAGNVLGYIGEVDTTYLRKHKTEGYEMGDYAGLTGLEATYEPVLMGQRGVKRFIRDNKNRIQGSYENGNYDTAAVAGRNLYTSMDIELQQLAEKLLGSKIGSAVAINPKTGGILAMATSPTYNPNLLTGSERRKNFSQLFLDTARPLLNRAIKGQYPPGSTFKPLGALVALDEGLITPSFGYGCSGAYYSCGRPVKCEHHDAGHAANLRAALSHSCNSYFSQVFRMAIDNPNFSSTQQGYLKWKEYMNAFGLGVRLNIDLPSEDKGNIPDTSKYNRDFAGPRWNSCNILTLGIGQDRMLATPLQLANAMCFIANKGYYYTPHFVDSIENESITDTSYLGKYRTKHKVTNITNDVFDAVQLAMLDVTRSGTAVNAKIDGIDICAKTGTAQNPHGKNHSLFVAFAPMDDPKIAIAVVVENAGFGSTWAAPIASLMMEKYLNDTISAKRLPEVDRISKADLIPAAIKHWYAVKDSIKLAKLAKQIDADKAPVFENTTDNRKHTFDPEAEPNRKENDSTDVSAKDSGIIPKQYQPRKPK